MNDARAPTADRPADFADRLDAYRAMLEAIAGRRRALALEELRVKEAEAERARSLVREPERRTRSRPAGGTGGG